MFRSDDWMAEFLGVPFFSASLDNNLEAMAGEGEDFRAELKTNEPGIYEIRLRGERIQFARTIGGAGFSLVDGKLEFRTRLERLSDTNQPKVGEFRLCEWSDFPRIEDLTRKGFTNNPKFHGRFNNRYYFSEQTSQEYYMAWNYRAMEQSPGLFGVWDNDGVRAFYNINRKELKTEVEYKVGLAAVEENSPLKGIQNSLQSWIYSQTKDTEFYVVNSPALSNYAGLINNIRAGRSMVFSELIFFRAVGIDLPVRRERM